MIAKAEHTAQGSNPRFLVTHLDGDPQDLYDRLYCARGEMENRIKEQVQLFADRTSCHRGWLNPFRLLLSSFAYVLVETIRRVGSKKTALAQAQVQTIRLMHFNIGAAIVRHTRRVRILMSSSYPRPRLFAQVVAQLDTPADLSRELPRHADKQRGLGVCPLVLKNQRVRHRSATLGRA